MTDAGNMQASQGDTNQTRCVGGMRAILASVRLNRLRYKTREEVGGRKWEVGKDGRMLSSARFWLDNRAFTNVRWKGMPRAEIQHLICSLIANTSVTLQEAACRSGRIHCRFL